MPGAEITRRPGFHDTLGAKTRTRLLCDGLQSVPRDECGQYRSCTNRVGGMFGLFFTRGESHRTTAW